VQAELWIAGWAFFVVVLAVVRSRRRRSEWLNQPGLSVISPYDPSFIGPLPILAEQAMVDEGDDAVEATEEPSEDPRAPAVHVVPSDVAEYLIPGFRPNLDICQVDLCYPNIDFVHWRSAGMGAMTFTHGEKNLTVFFQGLDVVPFDGVYVRFDHPRKGPQSYLLSELLDVNESEITEEEAGLKLDAQRDVAGCDLKDDSGPMEFRDFDASKECIEVFVPEDRLATTAVSISTTPDGVDTLVLVDGCVAAVLIGTMDAGPRNVKLVAADQTAAA